MKHFDYYFFVIGYSLPFKNTNFFILRFISFELKNVFFHDFIYDFNLLNISQNTRQTRLSTIFNVFMPSSLVNLKFVLKDMIL